MGNDEKILEMLQAMQASMTSMQTDMTAMQADMKAMTFRLDKLEEGQQEIKADTERKLKETEGRMIALMETHFAKMIGSLTAGQDLIIQKMAEQTDLDDTRAELEGRLDILEAAVKLHSREIEKLKKAQ